jgi:hypothetical protein
MTKKSEIEAEDMDSFNLNRDIAYTDVDWKSGLKKTKIRLVIIGLILAVAGWFLLAVMLFGRLGIEGFLQSAALTWGFRISVIGTTIVLIARVKWLAKALQDRKVIVRLYIFYGIGFIGWLWGIIDLLA